MNMFLWGLIALAAFAIAITLYLFFEEAVDRLIIKLHGGIPKGFIIFIIGTNGVGKTTIANKLSKKIGFNSVVETDDLRECLRSREDLFECSSKSDEYELLKASSYLSDGIEVGDDEHRLIGYHGQCKIMTDIILAIVKRKQKNKHSAIFEGINIMPTQLVEKGIMSRYILFVHLQVMPDKLLKKRLEMKTDDVSKLNEYQSKINEIMKTSSIISDDFEKVKKISHSTRIHTITLINDKSDCRTTRKIVRKVRNILTEK